MKTHVVICIITKLFLHSLVVLSTEPTIQELLRSKGLPSGLLPRGVRSYNLDQDGQLEVRYDKPCLTRFEGEVRFDRVVKGNLSYGGFVGVQGMSERELFLWFNVKDIIVSDPNSGVILFNIGVVKKQLSFSLFEVPPICRPQYEGVQMSGRKETGFEDGR